ncbi:MAG: NAD(P)/FAD-dependent oxidoreductase [Pseudonocardiaceae bacterium]
MEAQLCASDPVVVVGGGNSAGQATVFLAEHVGQLRLVVRKRRLTDYMSRYLADRIERDQRIEVLLHIEVRELLGECSPEAVSVEDIDSGEKRTLEARELFVFIGASGSIKRVASAVGEGSMAIRLVHEHLATHGY